MTGCYVTTHIGVAWEIHRLARTKASLAQRLGSSYEEPGEQSSAQNSRFPSARGGLGLRLDVRRADSQPRHSPC